MSPDERALLRAVAAAPADDLPRLVYADWLEEHGRGVRAEFIRLQCEVAKLESDRGSIRRHHAGLWQRQEDLLTHHRPDLLGPLAGLPGTAKVEFDRGFPVRVQLPVADFLAHGAALEAAVPLPRVKVTGVAADLAGFARSPHLGCVTEVTGYAPGMFDRTPEFPTDDPDLLQGAADKLARLEVLDLEGCGLEDWFCDLYWNFSLPALVELDLSNNHITDVGVADLLRCDLPRRLILGGNPITDQGAVELADRLGRSPVEYLNVRGTLIGQAGHRALLATFGRVGKKVDLF